MPIYMYLHMNRQTHAEENREREPLNIMFPFSSGIYWGNRRRRRRDPILEIETGGRKGGRVRRVLCYSVLYCRTVQFYTVKERAIYDDRWLDKKRGRGIADLLVVMNAAP